MGPLFLYTCHPLHPMHPFSPRQPHHKLNRMRGMDAVDGMCRMDGAGCFLLRTCCPLHPDHPLQSSACTPYIPSNPITSIHYTKRMERMANVTWMGCVAQSHYIKPTHACHTHTIHSIDFGQSIHCIHATTWMKCMGWMDGVCRLFLHTCHPLHPFIQSTPHTLYN